MAIPTPAPTPEGFNQIEALAQRFMKAVGFFIVPHQQDGSASPATGFLVQFQGKRYFVSASHNFFNDVGGRDQVIKSWGATRFKFRDDSPLERVESLNEAAARVKSYFGLSMPLSLPEGLLIDDKHDLIAVRVDPSFAAITHAEFINLESEYFTGELKSGYSLVTIGVTLSSQVDAPGAGPTLIPQLEHVRFDPDIETSGMTHDCYSPNYFFMRYSLTQDGIDPHGFSGAPIIVNKEPSAGELWTASPHVVGIALRYFKKNNRRKDDLLMAAKISTVIELLKSDKD
jgi:hypothetical protein